MPILKSSKKALKVSHRRYAENLEKKHKYKSAIRSVRKTLESGKSEGLEEQLKNAKSSIDKAAKTNTIPKNKAARLKSRLAKNVSKELNRSKSKAKK